MRALIRILLVVIFTGVSLKEIMGLPYKGKSSRIKRSLAVRSGSITVDRNHYENFDILNHNNFQISLKSTFNLFQKRLRCVALLQWVNAMEQSRQTTQRLIIKWRFVNSTKTLLCREVYVDIHLINMNFLNTYKYSFIYFFYFLGNWKRQ